MGEKKSMRDVVVPILGKVIGGLIITVLGKLKGKPAGADDDDKKAVEEMIEKEVKK